MARIESVESTCAIKEALNGHQRSSVVISGHQRSSVFISGHQWSSAVISVHQRSSVVISGHQRGSDPYGGDAKTAGHERREGGLAGARGATKEKDDAPVGKGRRSEHMHARPEPEVPPKRRMTHLPSSVAIRGHQWCHQWSSEVISSHQWKCVIIRGSPAVINGHQWSSEVIVVINGHQRSSTVLISDQRTVAAP
jgi:hypothetical protein